MAGFAPDETTKKDSAALVLMQKTNEIGTGRKYLLNNYLIDYYKRLRNYTKQENLIHETLAFAQANELADDVFKYEYQLLECYANKNDFDKAEKLLHDVTAHHNFASDWRAIMTVANYYKNKKNISKSDELYQRALDVAADNNARYKITQELAELHMIDLNLEKAEVCIHQSDILRSRPGITESGTLHYKVAAEYAYHNADIASVISNYLKSAEEALKFGDYSLYNATQIRLGAIYQQVNDYETAKQYYIDANVLASKYGDDFGKALSLYYRGGLEKDLVENHGAAVKYFTEAIAAFKAINRIDFLFLAQLNLSTALLKKGSYAEAENTLNTIKSEHDIDHSLKYGKILYFLNNSILYSNTNRLHDALLNGTKALQIVGESKIKDQTLIDVHSSLSSIYEKMGDMPKALKHQRLAYQYQVNVYSSNRYAKTIKTSFEYKLAAQEEINQLRLETLNKDREKLLVESNNQRRLATLTLVVVALLLFLFFSLYKLYKDKTQLNTNLLQSNDKLLESNQNLNKAIQNLEVANKKLDESNESLSNFAAVAAHDIKAPIRTIGSFSTLLYKKYDKIFEKEDIEWLEFILADTARLSSIIDNLLAFSKLTKNLSHKEEVDLNKVIEVISLQLKSTLQDKNIAIVTTRPLPTLLTHKSLIFPLFMNLINNSIKFSKEGAGNTITIDWHEQGEHFLAFSIEDEGIGIPEKVIPNIFKLFSKYHKDENQTGSGIGLTTCSKVVSFFGGEIRAESVEDEWTKISFTFMVNGVSNNVYDIHSS